MDNNQSASLFSEEGIDLVELLQKLWSQRLLILKICLAGAILGTGIAFSIPKEYKTNVKLAPEDNRSNKAGQFGGLAAMAGINISSQPSGNGALSVDLYPDIVKSTPFLLELIHIPVCTKDGTVQTSFYEYLKEHQKAAWWSSVFRAPFRLYGGIKTWLGGKQPDLVAKMEVNPFELTTSQEQFIRNAKEKIAVGVDKKTGIISASVSMQDPLVSAAIMDSVLMKLQKYITNYRTQKAKHDLIFNEKLFREARERYYEVQKEYARYVDENRNVTSASYRTEEERLHNEVVLAYGIYNQMAQQLELQRVKVQEQTPVYTVIEPARVPVSAIKPDKVLIVLCSVFFSGVFSVVYILGKEFMRFYKFSRRFMLAEKTTDA